MDPLILLVLYGCRFSNFLNTKGRTKGRPCIRFSNCGDLGRKLQIRVAFDGFYYFKILTVLFEKHQYIKYF